MYRVKEEIHIVIVKNQKIQVKPNENQKKK